MRKSRFSDHQILSILRQAEAGTSVPDLCREHGISSATFYKWRAKFGGMDASLMARLKELEAENRRLKKMYAEERIKAEIRQEVIEGSSKAISSPGDGQRGSRDSGDQRPAGLRGAFHQPELLSVSAEAIGRERRDCRLADPPDPQPEELGVWAVLSVSAQRQGLPMESQAGLSDLPGVGAKPADQAEEAHRSTSAGAAGGAGGGQRSLVDGLHARQPAMRSCVPVAQRDRRLQP